MFQYHCPVNQIFDNVSTVDKTCILLIHFVYNTENVVPEVTIIRRVFNYYKYILNPCVNNSVIIFKYSIYKIKGAGIAQLV
jgi:alpha-glucuronidase